MRVLASALILLAAALPAQAATPKRKPEPHAAAHPSEPVSTHLGGADAWNAYSYKGRSGRVCYLVGEPRRTEPAGFKRTQETAMVTHRPEEKVTNVVSFTEGTPLKAGSSASLDIDGTKYDLFTNGDTAWSRTSELDKTIVEAMIRGKQAVLKATPEKGPPTTDTYSLAGFSKALALIDKACGVKR
jgi:hypothetical protein